MGKCRSPSLMTAFINKLSFIYINLVIALFVTVYIGAFNPAACSIVDTQELHVSQPNSYLLLHTNHL
ncbi:MAG: hypothetical protein CM15mV42_1840 [uncultured marine virus]|nr:MAG: hypothetical protein CM15mV42_1840 [uncultured marine virus]